jgi:ATP-dependent RNA helicase DOB1
VLRPSCHLSDGLTALLGDLFSFIDNDSEESDWEIVSNVDSSPRLQLARAPIPSNKRSVNSPPSRTRTRKKSLSPPPEDEPPSKRRRLEVPSASVPAVVVDEFETEAKKGVAASAGLTGATEIAGSRLELRYQARPQASPSESLADCSF